MEAERDASSPHLLRGHREGGTERRGHAHQDHTRRQLPRRLTPDQPTTKGESMNHAVTGATFEQEVLKAPGPVLVDFWAAWCAPCHAVAPVLEQIAEARDLKLVKVDYDEEPGLAGRYGIQSLTSMLLFRDGAPKADTHGT